MRDDGDAFGAQPSRRAAVVGGVLLAALALGVEAAIAVAAKSRPVAAPADAVAPAPAVLPSLAGPAVAGVVLHPARGMNMQTFVPLPQTGEWFTTQAAAGTSGLVDQSGWAVGDIVVSRMAADGSLLDAMTLPDSGHGMGLIVRLEAGVRVLYTCWFAPGDTVELYDIVRIPYSPGIAARAAAATVVAGSGFPLDPALDPVTSAVTLRHQGGGGPEYTRHRWADFAAGDLTRPTGRIGTPDSPPTHQGFASLGDRFYFSTGAASTQPGGDPPRLTEYDWTTGRIVGTPLDTSGDARLPNGDYPGGSMEPEGAAVVVDPSGAATLLLGISTGPEAGSSGKVARTFRYPLAAV